MRRIFLISMLLLISGTVRAADCSNPSGPEAMLIYIPATHVEQYCNGTNWIPVKDTHWMPVKDRPAKVVPGSKEPPCPAVTDEPQLLSVACLTKGVMLRKVAGPPPLPQ